MLKAVLFDLDNTLYDEHTFVKSGFKAVSRAFAEKFGVSKEELYRCLWRFFLKVERIQVFDETLRHFEVYDANLVPDMLAVFRSHDPVISVFNDVRPALSALSQDFALALITDGIKEAQENKVKALRIADYFDVITYAEEYGGKSCPRPFNVTLQKLRVSAVHSMFVDDNPLKGFAVAKGLGIKTCRILRGENSSLRIEDNVYKPDFEVRSLWQLLAIVCQ